MEIFDLSSSTLVNTIKAHEGAVWSLDIKPDKTGLISGSADKSVKLWDFELVNDPANKVEHPKLLDNLNENPESKNIVAYFSPNPYHDRRCFMCEVQS